MNKKNKISETEDFLAGLKIMHSNFLDAKQHYLAFAKKKYSKTKFKDIQFVIDYNLIHASKKNFDSVVVGTIVEIVTGDIKS